MEPVYALPEAPRLVRPHEVAPWWARLVIAAALGAGAQTAVGSLLEHGGREGALFVLPFALAGAATLAADLDRPRPRVGYVAAGALVGGILTLVGAASVAILDSFRHTPFETVGGGIGIVGVMGSLIGFLGLRAHVDGRGGLLSRHAARGALVAAAVFGAGLLALRLFEVPPPHPRWGHTPTLADVIDARRAALYALALAAGLERAGARPPLLEAIRVHGKLTLVDEHLTSRMRRLGSLGRKPSERGAPAVEDDGVPFEPLSPEEAGPAPPAKVEEKPEAAP